MKKIPKFWWFIIIMTVLSALMALVGFFPSVCDKYTDHVYCHICDGISKLTARIPFPLGEILMYIGAAMLLLSAVFLILLIFLHKKAGYKKFCANFIKTFVAALTCVVFIYVPCWYIPFRGTVLGHGDVKKSTDYSWQELSAMMNFIVDGANQAAEEIEIKEDGTVEFPTQEESRKKVADAMRSLKDEYPRLAGYYPPVKTALCSDILDRMGIGGYNYPYTMEPTHNKYVSELDMLCLDAHELSHHKGYYKENEANFLSELALIQSDDPYLRLAGFMDMFDYVESDYYDALDVLADEMMANGEMLVPDENTTEEEIEAEMAKFFEYVGGEPVISERVWYITDYADGIAIEMYEEESHPIDEMPQVDEAIDTVSDKGWEVQEEILQENSYDGVTLLLLQYYDGKLY